MTGVDYKRLAPPDQPGVYLMRDRHGKIIYVGKALSLKKRLASYFRSPEQLDPKTRVLVPQIVDIEMMVTDSEVEALILENTLIKKHHPRYNILMRDDKSYPYLKVTVQEKFPRLLMTRRPFVDEAKYYGPFAATALRDLVRYLARHFQLALCRREVGSRPRPCLYFQMGQCAGACVGHVTPEDYRPHVLALIRFLDGGRDDVTPGVTTAMQRAAAEQRFEEAAQCRDLLSAISQIRHAFTVSSTGREDRDVVGWARSGTSVTVELFTVRSGNLEGRRHFFLQHTGGFGDDEIVAQILIQYYSQPVAVPAEILVPQQPADLAVIRLWLEKRRNGRVRINAKPKKEGARLLRLAETNAWLYLKSQTEENENEPTAAEQGMLDDLVANLNLPRLPVRIEGYDISNIAGQDPVGSQVVFVNARPDKSAYRRYQIRSVQGPNDFAMLQEMLFRRLKRLRDAHQARPDLLVIDGGAGQLSAVLAVLRELAITDVPVIGLAKRAEEIYQPGSSEPLRLSPESPGLKLLTRLRDEAHRFAVAYHRVVRGRRMTLSDLDRVEGLGPAKRRVLLRSFGSVESILQASETDVAAVPGIGLSLARRIQTALRPPAPRGRITNG